MIKKIFKRFLGLFLGKINKLLLENLEENKDEIIKTFNKKVNIPRLDEEQERILYTSVYSGLIEMINLLTQKKK